MAAPWPFFLALLLASLPPCLSGDVLEGSVRLAGGNTDAGRVEVFYQGRWGWICLRSHPDAGMTGWGKAEADVICKQLGLRTGVGTMRMANGKSADVLAAITAQCKGTEASITDCELQTRKTEQAGEEICQEDAKLPAGAGVRCTNFLAEEQPQVVMSGAEPKGLLMHASLRVECGSEPLPRLGEVGNGLPTFACAVKEHMTEDEVCAAGGSPGCNADSLRIPEPFVPSSALEAFVFQAPMEGHLLRAETQRSGAPSAHRRQLQSLTDRGVHWSSIGVDLGCAVPGRAGAKCPEASARETSEASLARNASEATFSTDELAAVRSLYLSPVARLLFDLDADVIGLTGRKSMGNISESLDADSNRVFKSLEDNGVAELGDMGLSDEIQLEALTALGEKATVDKLAAVRTPLPLLEQWLQSNVTMRKAVAAYFGGHAVLHGYKVVHLPTTLTPKEFISAHWHHDRAGRRLKLFILLNDVDPQEGHPTQVAMGSHHVSYYWHEEFEQSRYADEYVRREFEAVRLAGAKGTGYIFDTNTIHKGTPEGSQGRNVIVVEYHHAAKCGLISKLSLNIPCPSGDQKALNWYIGLD
ncbi:unnamed protein product [Polarella glacialis]|uniref:SRCR domain-containing protein n=1 Tax=Polarella glacialis TaxID=89957 RepID=A0A813IGB5_POLGL|nr:unnamed protein product [Polarella glacialis]